MRLIRERSAEPNVCIIESSSLPNADTAMAAHAAILALDAWFNLLTGEGRLKRPSRRSGLGQAGHRVTWEPGHTEQTPDAWQVPKF